MEQLESVFSKQFGNPDEGYTYKEALAKLAKVNDAHGVGTSKSRWKPGIIEPDPNKKNGYRVVIKTKEE